MEHFQPVQTSMFLVKQTLVKQDEEELKTFALLTHT